MLDIRVLKIKMKRILFVLIIFLISSFLVFSQEETKETFGLKIDESIKVDGFLNESAWEKEGHKVILFS